MLTKTRRLIPLLLAGLLIVPLAGTANADDTAYVQEPVTDAVLTQSALDLVTLSNRQRTALGLVALRIDPDLMAIAKTRAEVMATNDIMSHTEPNGQKVFDRINAAGLTWYAAGEIIVWNTYPTEPLSVAEAIRAWMASPGHREVMISTGYNYVGFGAAVSATGKRYYAGVYIKEPDESGAIARFRYTSKRSISGGRTRVTIRWAGHDARLQVLTSGLRYFEVQRRLVGGSWASWGTTTATSKTVTWSRAYDREVRVRARDKAGNWGTWRVLRINP
ncbi:MAG: CAP domain-containing protein [Chloroflexota bacterium]